MLPPKSPAKKKPALSRNSKSKFLEGIVVIHEYDVLVIGGGISGLYTASTAAQGKTRVAVVSKVHVTRSHSVAAQGGIAAALGNEEEDHWEWHMYDTVKGSDFLADQTACETLTQQAPAAILRAQRYIFDNRTANVSERLQIMQKPHGIWGCKTYYKCTLVCPKNIKVTQAILRTKKQIQEQQP